MTEVELRDGAVGSATKADFAGWYLLLEKYHDDAWLLYWRDSRVRDDDIEIGRDAGDRILPDSDAARDELRETYGVRWLQQDEAEVVRRRYFGGSPPPPVANLVRRHLWRLINKARPR